ncbi:DUF4232 domain-containing protein [Streptomyces halstedii]|uniref:DUF4232 domain-containing protein n=1 Tax=Streptomyces halstedii TaxID=1944 RepID=UPI00381FEA66
MDSFPRTPITPSGPTGRDRSTTTTRGGRRPGRYVLASVAAVSVALVTAGCQGGTTSAEPAGASRSVSAGAASDTPAPSDGSPTSADSPTASPPAAPSDPSASASAAPAGPHRCAADELTMSLKQADSGAGQVYYRLTLVNTSDGACALHGFPGVSLIKRDGGVIGAPAEREGPALPQKVIQPGKTAEVTLHTANQGVSDSPCWDRPDYLKVYPPGSKDALTLRTAQPQVCADRFTTTAIG